jgi:predicted Zn-dependent protease with MMP-like domain
MLFKQNRMSWPEFEETVKQGIAAIPKKFLKQLDNVEIVIEDEPAQEQLSRLKIGRGSVLLGLYEGVPRTQRWNYSLVLPDKITIFKKPIEAMAQGAEDIKRIVRDTVWHEIAHHFGVDESGVRALEIKRRNPKSV